MEKMCFLEWLRAVNHTPTVPKAYKQGNTLVSVKYLSPFNCEYFFQRLLMTFPHRAASELFHEQHEQMPPQIRFFASVVARNPLQWNDADYLKSQFEKEGNKDFFVRTLLSRSCRFGNQITYDTIHSAFSYPVKSDERPTINWNLSNYDLILLDEMSMVPERIARHVIATISEITIRPVIVMAGDNQQQQPIETIDKQIVQVHSVLHKKDFYTLIYHHALTKQYGTLDKRHKAFLQHIRYWSPS